MTECKHILKNFKDITIAYRRSKGIAPLFTNLGTTMEVSSQLHALTTLPLEKDPKTHVTGGCVGPGASVDGF